MLLRVEGCGGWDGWWWGRMVGWAVVGAGGGKRGGGLAEKAPIAKTNSNLGATKSAKRFHE